MRYKTTPFNKRLLRSDRNRFVIYCFQEPHLYKEVPAELTLEIMEKLKKYQQPLIHWADSDQYKEFHPHWAYVLRQHRLRRGLSQKQLGLLADIPPTNLSLMECGRRRMGRKIAMRLAKALEIDFRVLLWS